MSWRVVCTIARKEVSDAHGNRWVAVIAGVFAVLALALSYLGLSGLGTFGIAGFGRTGASLLTLVVLIVPLLGLILGALGIAPEREQGTLLTLLAQPVTRGEVLLGKALGLAATLLVSVALGFALSAAVIIHYAGTASIGGFLLLAAWSGLLGLACLAIGLCLSAAAPRQSTALGLAVAIWLGLVLISDVGAMGTAMVLRLRPPQVLAIALINPVQVFKLGATHALYGHLEPLGSVGLCASVLFGGWLAPALLAALAAWIAVPTGVAAILFNRRGAL
jgi:Cu-processing system permease protein